MTVNPGRTITLQQLSEQVKDTLCNIRPNGEFRLQAATWGREMVGNAVLGTIADRDMTEHIIGRAGAPVAEVDMIPISSVDAHWLMDNPAETDALATQLRARPGAYRVVEHPTGTVLVFERTRSLVTLLRPQEWQATTEALTTDEVPLS